MILDHGFRLARPARLVWTLAKTGLQVVVVWGFALALLPAVAVRVDHLAGLPRPRHLALAAAGAALFVAGSLLGLAAAWVMASVGRGTPIPFDAASELVVAGPYRCIRNPMACGAVAQSAGVAMVLGSPTAALIPVAGALLWNVGIRPSEERFLATTFGPAYAQYRSDVRCWVPHRPVAARGR